MDNMAREILFRAKRIDDGKWIDGDLTRCVVVEETHIHRIEDNLSTTTHRIDPETICQYTGLTDGNGVKIFENDICKLIADDELYQIQWDEDTARYVLIQFGSIMYDFDCLSADDIEAIGNIFDNPELMEES